MKLTDRDISFIFTLLLSHYRDLKGKKGPGPTRERAEAHKLMQKFEKLEIESRK